MSQTISLLHLPILIFLAPLLSAIVIGLLEGSLGRKAYQIGTLAQFVGLIASLFLLYNAGTEPLFVPVLPSILQIAGVVPLGFYIDRLAAVMMALISAIGLLITVFSIRYMQQDRGRARFHALLSVTTFTLLAMVASQNLFMLFVFWQLLSFLIYLLSHHYAHAETIAGATRAYVVFRFGDAAFLVGIVLLYHLYGTLDWQPLFTQVANHPYTFSLLPGGHWTIDATTLIALLIFIGAMSKSVQFPLNLWLPGALYAPTPVHALQHAGIINAGGFLLNRLSPLYAMSPTTLHIVFAVGLLTTLLGSSMMLTQNDIKKTLGHSTIGQMGYMMMECGLGAFGLAIFHLIAHGFFKATLFLNCGDVIHVARHEPKHPPSLTQNIVAREIKFSKWTWVAGFVMTLILPLIILMAVHGLLKIDLIASQGNMILLFFAWVTASQAILTLYRLQAVSSWKTVGMMLLTLVGVMFTYLFAAEQFTHFLYPNPEHVAFFFRAAALPGFLFDFMVSATASAIIAFWVILYPPTGGSEQTAPVGRGGIDRVTQIIYTKNVDATNKTHKWINWLYRRLYLLFINRLYLEALTDKLGKGFYQTANRLVSPVNTQIFFSLIGFVIMPNLGIYLLSDMRSPILPVEKVQVALRGLALLCALYGSVLAVASVWTRRLVPFAITASSIFWWHISYAKTITSESLVYISAAGLILGGLFFVRKMLATRYGESGLHHVGGLAQCMPRFAFLLSLLVMAAMGLPPFGLFSGLMGMLFHHTAADVPPIRVSWDLAIIALTWLFWGWVFLDLMRRILFGPHPSQGPQHHTTTDIPYRDLSLREGGLLVVVMLLLVVMGVVPQGFFIPLLNR